MLSEEYCTLAPDHNIASFQIILSESKLDLCIFPDGVPKDAFSPGALLLGRDKGTICHFCMQECVFTLSRWTLTGCLTPVNGERIAEDQYFGNALANEFRQVEGKELHRGLDPMPSSPSPGCLMPQKQVPRTTTLPNRRLIGRKPSDLRSLICSFWCFARFNFGIPYASRVRIVGRTTSAHCSSILWEDVLTEWRGAPVTDDP